MIGREPLRVAIDARLVSGQRGGVEQMVIGLASALSKLDDGDERYMFLVDPRHTTWIEPFVSGPASLLAPTSGPAARSARGGARRIVRAVVPASVLAAARRRRIDPLVVPPSDGTIERAGAQVMHFPMQVGFRTNVPVIYTPHDLQHLHLPEFFGRAEIARREATYRALCDEARIVVTLSAWAGEDVRRTYGLAADKMLVVAVPPPIEVYEVPTDADLARVRDRFATPDQFALYPAKAWPHKNHLRLLAAIRLLRDRDLEIPVLLTGSQGGLEEPVAARARELGVDDLVRFVGFVSPLELSSLYRMARVLVFPSLFEGWGLPVMEAMAAGLPVAASDVTSIPGVTAGAARLFDPVSPDAIADAIAAVWADEPLRRSLVERGRARAAEFSWDRTARIYRAAYRKVAGRELSDEDRALLAAPPLA